MATGSFDEVMDWFDGSVFDGKVKIPGIKVIETFCRSAKSVGNRYATSTAPMNTEP